MPTTPFFTTRGVILGTDDLATLDWPQRAQAAGLTTIATHITPSEVADFVATEAGQRFLAQCRDHGLAVEHELHAVSDLLPRALFDRDPTMFRMDEGGHRVREDNLCVHSPAALEVAAENVVRYTRLLPSTTGRYFYWCDDGRPMCRCPDCRGLSDSEQTLLLENHLLRAIRTVDANATLAHIVYHNTLSAPQQVRPDPGVFLEYAPISRQYDRPLRDRSGGLPGQVGHGELLDHLAANLAVFGSEGAQALEYWLDLSRFSGWKRAQIDRVPWHDEVFRDDLALYAELGIRHVTSFACWIDGDYVARFGEPPLAEYAAGLATVSRGATDR